MDKQLYRTEDPQFVRVGRDGAILNTDTKALNQYMQRRAELLDLKQVTQELSELRTEFSMIKELLEKLVAHG